LRTGARGQTFYGLPFLFARFLCSRQVGCLYAILVPSYKGGASALLGASGIVFMHIVGGACGTVFGFAVRRK
jgi:hypothetical protein